jgi:radical SAM superfamily enzyme YgiQ (UPF0313 family)
MKKLLLIQPSPYDRQGQPIKKARLHFVGLALPTLAALTPPGWEIELCLETIEPVPFNTDATLIGISSMGHAVMRTLDIAKEFRRRGKTVVVGGYMVSLMPEEAQKHCDSVVIGDAEGVWAQLVSDFEAGSLQPVYQKKLPALTTPVPRYDLLLNKKIGRFLPVQAGRGCPNCCSFCSVYCLYRGQYLRRPLEEVVRDIRQIKSLGFHQFLLLDDNILADPMYLRALCTEIETLGMTWLSQCSIEIGRDTDLLSMLARSGCRILSFGLESISKESLDAMDKSWADPADYPMLIRQVQEAGIDVSTEMVVGADGDTLDSIKETAEFVKKCRIAVPRFYILTPIPGTDFYHSMHAQGRICNEDIYSYNGTEAVHVPRHMTASELTEAYWDLYRDVFSLSNIAMRTLFRKESLSHPGRSLSYLIANLYYRYSINRGITPNIY